MKKYYEEIVEKNRNDLLFSYFGSMNEEIFEMILHTIEFSYKDWKISKKIVRKLYYISVEILQNIYHHAIPIDNKKFFFFIIIREAQKEIRIITANLVNEEQKKCLDTNLTQLNALTKEELKALYRKVLDTGKRSLKGGGGLGFIEISRKTHKKLNFKFKKIDFYKFLFIFEVSLLTDKEKLKI